MRLQMLRYLLLNHLLLNALQQRLGLGQRQAYTALVQVLAAPAEYVFDKGLVAVR